MNQCLTNQTINVGLVGMGTHGILEEEHITQPSTTHEIYELSISSEWTRLARGTKEDVTFSLEDVLEHGHGAVGTGKTELLENVLVGDNELLHRCLHLIVRYEGEATHLGRGKGRIKVIIMVGGCLMPRVWHVCRFLGHRAYHGRDRSW